MAGVEWCVEMVVDEEEKEEDDSLVTLEVDEGMIAVAAELRPSPSPSFPVLLERADEDEAKEGNCASRTQAQGACFFPPTERSLEAARVWGSVGGSSVCIKVLCRSLLSGCTELWRTV